jgi:ABC-type multidrug transport system ATPase subunit
LFRWGFYILSEQTLSLATPAIEVKKMVKRYPARPSLRDRLMGRAASDFVTALNDANFNVAQGEVLGLLGPNPNC